MLPINYKVEYVQYIPNISTIWLCNKIWLQVEVFLKQFFKMVHSADRQKSQESDIGEECRREPRVRCEPGLSAPQACNTWLPGHPLSYAGAPTGTNVKCHFTRSNQIRHSNVTVLDTF